MANQLLLTSGLIACSVVGWYVVLAKYMALKAKLKAQAPVKPAVSPPMSPKLTNPAIHEAIDTKPRSETKWDESFATEGHIPGMGLPPLANLPFQVPPEVLESIKKSTTSQAPAAGSGTKPQPAPVTTQDDMQKRKTCNWACILHLSGLAFVTGIPFLNIIFPTVLWLAKKEQHPYLAKQGREIINFQISFTLLQILCLGFGAFFMWLLPELASQLLAATRTVRVVFSTSMNLPCNIFTFIPFLWGMVQVIRGAVAAYNGLTYKYPFTQTFLFDVPRRVAPPTPVPAPPARKEPLIQAEGLSPIPSKISFG